MDHANRLCSAVVGTQDPLAAEPEEGHSSTGLAQRTLGEGGRCARMCNRDV
jgi:hypothetical protein